MQCAVCGGRSVMWCKSLRRRKTSSSCLLRCVRRSRKTRKKRAESSQRHDHTTFSATTLTKNTQNLCTSSLPLDYLKTKGREVNLQRHRGWLPSRLVDEWVRVQLHRCMTSWNFVRFARVVSVTRDRRHLHDHHRPLRKHKHLLYRTSTT